MVDAEEVCTLLCVQVCVYVCKCYKLGRGYVFACEFVSCVRVCVGLSLGGGIMSVVVTVGFLALVAQPVLPSYSPPPPFPGGNC